MSLTSLRFGLASQPSRLIPRFTLGRLFLPSAITFAKPIAITITTRSSDIRQAITITIIEHIKCSSFNIILFKALNSV
nr:MAG TPA: hypothetical protein [Caudoviricetes sp.]